MSTAYSNLPFVKYEGPQSKNPFAYKWYDAKRVVLGKTLAEHLRPAVCRKWPLIEYFGHPRILKGCGFQAVHREK